MNKCAKCEFEFNGLSGGHVCDSVANEQLSKIMSQPRPFSLVRVKKEYEALSAGIFSPKELPLIYMGEIPNMKGHAIVFGSMGKVYRGFHIDQFEEIPEDEV